MKYLLLCLALLSVSAVADPNPNPYAENGVGPKYRIAEAYKDADLVVVGKAGARPAGGGDQRFAVEYVVKGKAGARITLRGQRPVNTEINGFSLPEGLRCLLLLRKAGKVYDRVDGFNSPGPNFYEVQENTVVITAGAGTKAPKVPFEHLKEYFESNPPPLTLP